jgi:excisionase family DNA binding protein
MYNQKQAAKYTGKGLMTIRRHIEKKNLVGVKVDDRTVLFTQSELDAWVKTIGNAGRPPKGGDHATDTN